MFFFLFFLLFSLSPVYADDFNSTGDSVSNLFFQTTALTVSYLPNSSGNITYDEAEVIGIYTNTAIQNYTISNLTTAANMRRNGDLLDKISGPPGTEFDILYFYFNDTGHSIDISKITIPYSRSVPGMGNLVNVADFDGGNPETGRIEVLFNRNNLVKDGLFKEYEGLGVLENGDIGSFVIQSGAIKNPIEIESISITEDGEDLNLKVILLNNSTELFNHILFEHQSFSSEFSMEAGKETVLEYTLSFSEDLGYFEITNNNIKTECSIYGGHYYDWYAVNSITAFAFREDGGWVNGAYVQPEQESFCITRLPYIMKSEEIRYEKIGDDDNIVEIEIEEILGIQDFYDDNLLILPKTGKNYED